MNRRSAIATAGAVTLTVLAGTTAIAANVGILGSSPAGKVGDLSPVAAVSDETTTTEPTSVETIVVDTTTPFDGYATTAPSVGDTADSGSDDATVDTTLDVTPVTTDDDQGEDVDEDDAEDVDDGDAEDVDDVDAEDIEGADDDD